MFQRIYKHIYQYAYYKQTGKYAWEYIIKHEKSQHRLRLLFFVISRSMMLEYVKDRCLVQSYSLVVYHSLAHNLINVAQSSNQRLSLH